MGLEGLVSELRVEPVDDGMARLQFAVEKRSGALTAALDTLRAAGITILSVQSELPTLEKVFAHYAGPEERA
jgi:ACT domain-containing protein